MNYYILTKRKPFLPGNKRKPYFIINFWKFPQRQLKTAKRINIKQLLVN
jgi:hypothetical protein